MSVSDLLKADAWQPASRLPLIALTLSHDDLAQTIRVVNNNEAVEAEGQTYTAFPFELSLPDATEDAPPRAKLKIDNVSREIAEAVRSINTPADVTIRVLRVVDPIVDDFTSDGFLPTGYTHARATSDYDGSYVDANGLLQDASAGAPRWTYDPLAGSLRGFLNEPERTNLQDNSEQPRDNSGGYFNTPGTITVGSGTLAGKTVSRAELKPSGFAGQGAGAIASFDESGETLPGSGTLGRVYAVSFYVGNNGGDDDTVRFQVIERPHNLNTINLGSVTLDGGRKEFVHTLTEDDVTDLLSYLGAADDSGADYDFHHGLVQVERVPIGEDQAASSYVPTSSSSQTRARDVLTRTGLPNGVYNVTVTRDGVADEVLANQSVTAGTFEVPTSPYPLRSVTFTPTSRTGAVELEYPGFRLSNVTVDALTVEGQLDVEDLVREPFPAYSFSPAEYPGIVS